MKTLKIAALPLILLAFSTLVLATTWVETEVACPVCQTKNKFRDIMSYGSYIYNWPSKYQFIFWPRTDANVLYTCRKCYLSLFMWDFRKFPADKTAEVQGALAGISLSGSYESYNRIPMSERLAIAEKIYAKLDRDHDFWCDFYRVQGYHLAHEKKSTEADAARRRALELAELMMSDAKRQGSRKELLYIAGAMRHFLNDDPGAVKDLEQGLQLTFNNPSLTAAQNNNANANLNRMLQEYLDGIKNNKIPRDDGSDR